MDIIGAIDKLKNYKDSNFPILSIYLGSTDKKTPKSSYFISQLRSLVGHLSEQEQKFWQKDIDRIEEYLLESLGRSDTRSLVFFTAGKNLWEVLNFEFFLPPLCTSLYKPYLNPIEDALGTYQKYLVLLVDREKARLFTVHLGKIEEHKDIFNGQVPQRVRAKTINFGRTDKIMRDIEGHLHRHLQLIAKATKEFVNGKNIRFIIVGGHHELIPKIKKHLRYPLNKMVLGEFISELNIPLSTVLQHSKKIAVKINQRLSKRQKTQNKGSAA